MNQNNKNNPKEDGSKIELIEIAVFTETQITWFWFGGVKSRRTTKTTTTTRH